VHRRISVRKMLSRAFKEHQTEQAAHRQKQGIPTSLIFSLVLKNPLCCKLKLLLLTQ